MTGQNLYRRNTAKWGSLAGAGFSLKRLLAQTAPAGQTNAPTGYTDTPFLPGSKWRVHDDARPRPPVITPGTFSTPRIPGKPPSDAVVLFDGASLAAWRTEKGQPAKWKVGNGYMQVLPGGGDILTRGEFGDSQLHIEWSAPAPPKGDTQERGNTNRPRWSMHAGRRASGNSMTSCTARRDSKTARSMCLDSLPYSITASWCRTTRGFWEPPSIARFPNSWCMHLRVR